MRTLIPNYIGWGYSPACSQKRLLVGDRFGNADTGPPPDTGGEPSSTGDPYWSYVVLLVGSDSGHNVDESTQKPKGDGGGGVSTNARFGPYSIEPSAGLIDFGGKGSDPSTDDFDLSHDQMGEFTIEAWIYLTATPTDPQVICGKSFLSVAWAFMTNGTELRFAYQVLDSGFGGHGNFTNVITSGANLVGGQWRFVAMDKDAYKNYRLYVDGIMMGKLTPNDASIDTWWLESLSVGEIGLFGTNNWIGEIDELRITKGVARYQTDGSFPVPTGPFPRGV